MNNQQQTGKKEKLKSVNSLEDLGKLVSIVEEPNQSQENTPTVQNSQFEEPQSIGDQLEAVLTNTDMANSDELQDVHEFNMVMPDAPSITPEKKEKEVKTEKITWGTEAFKKAINLQGIEELKPFADNLIVELDEHSQSKCPLCSQEVKPIMIVLGSEVVITVLLLYYLKMIRETFPYANSVELSNMLVEVFGADESDPNISPQAVDAMMKIAFAAGAIQKSIPDEKYPIQMYTIFASGLEYVQLEKNPLTNHLAYNKQILGFADKGVEQLGKSFKDIVNDDYSKYGDLKIDDTTVDAYDYFKTITYNVVSKFCQTNNILTDNE
jgi:hypothetical protein